MMEDRFVFLVFNRPHTVHAAHVVNSVHGSLTLATPIMESRVMTAASCSSFSLSLPAGLSESTRYRTSAVLSQTRTSTSSANSRPNSRKTPRGSSTAYRRRDCESPEYFPQLPCPRPANHRIPIPQSRPSHPSKAALCRRHQPRRVQRHVRRFVDQSCARRCRSAHRAPPDPRALFERATTRALLLLVSDP